MTWNAWTCFWHRNNLSADEWGKIFSLRIVPTLHKHPVDPFRAKSNPKTGFESIRSRLSRGEENFNFSLSEDCFGSWPLLTSRALFLRRRSNRLMLITKLSISSLQIDVLASFRARIILRRSNLCLRTLRSFLLKVTLPKDALQTEQKLNLAFPLTAGDSP